MYTPIIPSVTTSVIDRSSIDIQLNGSRTILLPIFSKYGRERFVRHESVDEFRYNLGRQDIKKYGRAYLYGEAAARTDNVITYRLLPDDATYGNNVIRNVGTTDLPVVDFKTYSGIYSKSDMTYVGTQSIVDDNIVLSALATARGEGYNSIFTTFTPATAHEKMDSDINGETNYKFNFIQAEVFEETNTGIKSLGDPVVFSLIEVDSKTNEPITDKISGQDLFINSIFKDANDFATINVNPAIAGELSEFATIDDLVTERLIIKDEVQDDKFYEIKVETYDRIVIDANGVKQRIPSQRLSAIITTDKPSITMNGIFNYDSGDADALPDLAKRIVVTSSVITIADAAFDANNPTSYKVDGEDSFYELSYDQNLIVDGVTGNIKMLEVQLLRQKIYKQLMNYSMKLYSGSDGTNTHINNTFNLMGASSDGKQNCKELLLDFYNNTEDLREILYPKYDFDYIPDWTGDAQVQVSIIDLADDIGLSMPILSLPLEYNPTIVTKNLTEKDLKIRKEKLFQSSYNSAMYSGQQNKTHRTSNNLRLYMPLSYYAMVAHLRIDNQISITEPVANMLKGTLASTELNLTYAPTSLEIEKLRNQQINTVIVEPDGTYIIDQLTMYKKASKLSRINIVKVLHRIRKNLPKLLKDLLQTKAVGSIIDTAVTRTEAELAKWVITPENEIDGIFQSVNVKATFNEDTYKLRLTITVNPVGTLESIDIPIIVV